MSKSNQLILIDGSSFLYRAYFAVRQNFSTKDGVPTGATYVLTRMFRSLLDLYKGNKFIAVFDAKGPSFRNEMYDQYKATRPPMPDDLRPQIEFAHSMVRALGIPLVSVSGVEADDVLGSYAKDAEKKGIDTVICTGDKDLAQLVNEHITLLDTMKNVHYDVDTVKEKFGVPPEYIIDFLALKGDSSDNIPGMKGVGDKTAISIINSLGGILSIKEHLDEVANLSFRGAGTFKDKFLEQWPTIELSYRLATIKCDVELPLDINEITPPQEDHDSLIALFERLEFHKFAAEQRAKKSNSQSPEVEPVAKNGQQDLFNNAATQDTSNNSSNQEQEVATPIQGSLFGTSDYEAHQQVDNYRQYFKTVLNSQDLNELINDINQTKLFSFHIAASEGHPTDATIIGISICTSDKSAYYIPFNHNYIIAPEQLSYEDTVALLKPIFADESIKKIAYDLKLMRLYLHFANLPINGYLADPMIVAHILDSSRKVDLAFLSESFTKYTPMSLDSIKENKKDPICTIAVEKYSDYECEQALMAYRVYHACMKDLSAMEHGEELVAFDMKVLDVLFNMEKTGTYIDGDELNEQARTLKSSLNLIEQDIYDLANTQFNINSPRQLGKVLFDDLNIPYPRKSNKKDQNGNKKYSTADDILSDIGDDFDIVRKVQRYRMLSKLVSTYTDKLPLLISPKTGRIHTCFNLAGTVTGRLSSSDPNLQNIPSRTKEGRQIRSAFVAPKGYKIVSADYSQIELRLIAHFAQDPNLIAAFNNHQDIHRVTAAEVLDKSINDVTDEERSHAKATNFGLMYGMSAHGLAKQTGMSNADAKAYIEKYFSKYPTIKTLMDNIIKDTKAHGYTTTIKGFHIVINGITSTGAIMRGADRAAINAPMQGSAADIIKMAMIEVDEYIKTLPQDAVHMTMQVHDELVFEVREDIVDTFCSKIQQIMENVTHLLVPLEVGIGVGSSWADAH